MVSINHSQDLLPCGHQIPSEILKQWAGHSHQRCGALHCSSLWTSSRGLWGGCIGAWWSRHRPRMMVYLLALLFTDSAPLDPFSCLCLFFFFLVELGFELRALQLVKQMLYNLSHVASLFCFSYFSGKIWTFCLGQPGSSYFYLLSCWGCRYLL
jgi:hypothetical protein